MKKLLAGLTAIAAATVSLPAAAQTAEGRVISLKDWSIQLERPYQFFTAGDASTLQGVQPGDRVRVNWAELPEGEKRIIKVERLPNQ